MYKGLKKKFREDFFRCCIFGASQSGKTYWLVNILIPDIINQYDEIFVFTRSHNNEQYKRVFKKYRKDVHIINRNFIGALTKIRKLQDANIKKVKKNGEPVYHANLLLIWDDVLDEKLFRDPSFLDQFTNLRHLQASTIVISQILNQAVTTQMKANTNIFVLFRMNHYRQRGEIVKLIEETIIKEYERAGRRFAPEKIKREAKNLYNEFIVGQDYGYLVTDDFQELYFE
jgi:hypothetical protein